MYILYKQWWLAQQTYTYKYSITSKQVRPSWNSELRCSLPHKSSNADHWPEWVIKVSIIGSPTFTTKFNSVVDHWTLESKNDAGTNQKYMNIVNRKQTENFNIPWKQTLLMSVIAKRHNSESPPSLSFSMSTRLWNGVAPAKKIQDVIENVLSHTGFAKTDEYCNL